MQENILYYRLILIVFRIGHDAIVCQINSNSDQKPNIRFRMPTMLYNVGSENKYPLGEPVECIRFGIRKQILT